MEFNEKLQGLRKEKGLTQEELAESLFVSRTAVSRWESGRGYPNIESLKDISAFFNVSIDELLSGERLLSIAEKENKSNISGLCNLFYGIADLFSFIRVVLPLYPNTVEGFVYSVSLFNYKEASPWVLALYWVLFILLFLLGFAELVLTRLKKEKVSKLITEISLSVNIITIIFLALTSEVYAVITAFLLLIIKGVILFKKSKI